jgi:cytochrome P450
MGAVAREAGDTPVDLPTTRTAPFDLPAELARLRDKRPVTRLRFPDGGIGWLVTSYAHARTVLSDGRFGMGFRRMPVGDPAVWAAVFDALEATGISLANLAELDPPEHTRVRRVLSGPFSRPQIASHTERVERIVGQTLDAVEAAGPPADLVSAFSTPIAAATQCVMLGAPEDDGDRFLKFNEVAFDPRSSVDEVREAFRDFCEYLKPLIAAKRKEPEEDLMSYVLGRGDLGDDEIFSIIAQLFIAGHGTVRDMLSLTALFVLSADPKLRTLWCDFDQVNAAVEELLRYLTIFQVSAHTRKALEDVELGGRLIRAGQSVTVSLAAANRDPQQFEHPESFDHTTSASGHLGFGHGRHVCLGQHLARLEMRLALPALFERFPELRLAVPVHEVTLLSGDHFNYGVRDLLVTW